MAGYFNVPSETNESVFLTYTDWIGYVKDDGTYGYLLKNGVPPPVTWTDVTGKPTTFPATLGTTSATAKAGNYKPTWSEINSVIPPYATFAPILGTSSTSAKPGNWYPSWENILNVPDSFPVDFSTITNKPNTLAGYGIENAITSETFSGTLGEYPTYGSMQASLNLKAKSPDTVAALGAPSLVPTLDIQALYDKVNELLTALKV